MLLNSLDVQLEDTLRGLAYCIESLLPHCPQSHESVVHGLKVVHGDLKSVSSYHIQSKELNV